MKVGRKVAVAAVVLSLTASVRAARSADSWALTPKQEAQVVETLGRITLAKPAKAHKVLIVSQAFGYVHKEAMVWGNRAFELAGQKFGVWNATVSREASVLTNAALLAGYDAVLINNCTSLLRKRFPEMPGTLIGYVKGGGGLCLIHAALDSFNDAKDVQQMAGGFFRGHPWWAGGNWKFRNEKPDSALTAPFAGAATFFRSDEIYSHGTPPFDRATCTVLVSLDMTDSTTRAAERAWAAKGGPIRADGDYAVSWVKTFGKGRIFYSSFAHDGRAYRDPQVAAHLMLGLQYCLKDL